MPTAPAHQETKRYGVYYLGKTWLTEAKIDESMGDTQGARSAAQAAYLHFVASVGETHPLTAEAIALARTGH